MKFFIVFDPWGKKFDALLNQFRLLNGGIGLTINDVRVVGAALYSDFFKEMKEFAWSGPRAHSYDPEYAHKIEGIEIYDYRLTVASIEVVSRHFSSINEFDGEVAPSDLVFFDDRKNILIEQLTSHREIHVYGKRGDAHVEWLVDQGILAQLIEK